MADQSKLGELQEQIDQLKVVNRKMAHTLRAQREQSDLVLQTAPVSIVIFSIGPAGGEQVYRWNEEARRMFDREQGETRACLLPLIMDEGSRAVVQNTIAQLKSGNTPENVAGPIEIIGIRKDGALFPMEVTLGLCPAGDGTLLYTLAARDISARKQAEEMQSQAIVWEERQRLARDLHDTVSQYLYGLVTLTEVGQAYLETGRPESVGHTLSRVGEEARKALREMRLYLHQLRAPELAEAGLVGAILQRIEAVEGRANMDARLVVEGDLHLPANVEQALYFIAQEALNNVLRHAGATVITVHLRQDGEQVIMEVVDNGCGFNISEDSHGGMGLVGMRERMVQLGGEIEITSFPGETQVKVKVVLGSPPFDQ